MSKIEILNVAIRLAQQEAERALRNHNLLQIAEMKGLIRKLLQLRDGV